MSLSQGSPFLVWFPRRRVGGEGPGGGPGGGPGVPGGWREGSQGVEVVLARGRAQKSAESYP